ncbi:MAG: hypothetical protein ACTSYB_05140 [Candidatus Helarchaeota archaeon]
MFVLTNKAKEAIQEDLEFYLSMEEENLQRSDLGLILFVRKQSCSPMTDGGYLEVGVAVEPIKNYQSTANYKKVEILKDLQDLPVFVEDKALKMLGDRKIVEIDARGSIEKELIIRDGPIKDLGACEVRFSRK